MLDYKGYDILQIHDCSDCDILYVTDIGGAYGENDCVSTEVLAQDDKNRYSHIENAIISYEMEQLEYPPLESVGANGMESMDVFGNSAPVKPDIGSLTKELFNLGGFYLLGQELCRMSESASCYERADEKTLRNFVRDVCATSRVYENFYTAGKFNEIKDRIESLCRLWGFYISDDEYSGTRYKGFSNGVFDFGKMMFIEKTEHNYIRAPVFHALNCEYVPKAGRKGKTNSSKNFLVAICGSDEKLARFIKELFAKILVERRSGKRLFWIVEPTGLLYELLRLFFEEVLGVERVSTVILSKLKESKIFALDGAMVNLSCETGLSELSTSDFPMSEILSPNITTYRASKKTSFPNGTLFVNITKAKPLITADLKKECTVFELPCDYKESAESVFEKIKQELPYVVSYLIDSVYADMLKRDSVQIDPDESLITEIAPVINVNTVDDCIERYFSKGKYEVIIKEDAYVLYARYSQTNGYTPIGRNFFYDAIRERGFKEGKKLILDKKTNESISRRTVFIGISHSSRKYSLSPIEIEKMKLREDEKGD